MRKYPANLSPSLLQVSQSKNEFLEQFVSQFESIQHKMMSTPGPSEFNPTALMPSEY